MEIVGKLLFLILFSISIGAGAVYFIGPSFFTSALDEDIFEDKSYEFDSSVDVKAYREKLRREYKEYDDRSSKPSEKSSHKKEELWEDSIEYGR